MSALHHGGAVVLHVVAQVVEAELVVRAVGHVGGIGRAALLVVQSVHDDADGEAKEAVDAAHPLRVAACEVVVDGDDVNALAFQSVEIDGEGRDQSLALTGAHFRNLPRVQDHATDELHIVVPLAENAARGLAYGGEGGLDEMLQLLAGGQFLAEGRRTGAQLIVAQPLQLVLERVYGGDPASHLLDAAVVCASEKLFGECAEAGHVAVLMLHAAAARISKSRRRSTDQIDDTGACQPQIRRNGRGEGRTLDKKPFGPTGRAVREIRGGRKVVNAASFAPVCARRGRPWVIDRPRADRVHPVEGDRMTRHPSAVSGRTLAGGLFALALAFGVAAPAQAQEPGDAVAKVGDATITEADIAFASRDFADQLRQVPPTQWRGVLTDVMVDMQVMANAAPCRRHRRGTGVPAPGRVPQDPRASQRLPGTRGGAEDHRRRRSGRL